jgi:hypothetical protein
VLPLRLQHFAIRPERGQHSCGASACNAPVSIGFNSLKRRRRAGLDESDLEEMVPEETCLEVRLGERVLRRGAFRLG